MDIQTRLRQRAQELRLMRKVCGLTQGELACISGVTQAAISNIERGKTSWSVYTELLLTITMENHINRCEI